MAEVTCEVQWKSQLKGTGPRFRCVRLTSVLCVAGISEHSGAQPSRWSQGKMRGVLCLSERRRVTQLLRFQASQTSRRLR